MPTLLIAVGCLVLGTTGGAIAGSQMELTDLGIGGYDVDLVSQQARGRHAQRVPNESQRQPTSLSSRHVLVRAAKTLVDDLVGIPHLRALATLPEELETAVLAVMDIAPR